MLIVSLIPLSVLLRQASMGYKLKNENVVVNNLFYMDDLKLYVQNSGEIQSLIGTVNIVSADIGVTFCASKCARLSLKRGKHNISEGINLPSGDLIKSLEATDSYVYLRVVMSSRRKD